MEFRITKAEQRWSGRYSTTFHFPTSALQVCQASSTRIDVMANPYLNFLRKVSELIFLSQIKEILNNRKKMINPICQAPKRIKEPPV
jgi:hypothetical protein